MPDQPLSAPDAAESPLAIAVRQAGDLMRVGRCAIVVPDQLPAPPARQGNGPQSSSSWLRCAALYAPSAPYDPAAVARWRLHLPSRSGLHDFLTSSHAPLTIEDVHASPLFTGLELGDTDIRSLLLAPLRRNGTVLGILTFDDPGRLRPFQPTECALAATLAELTSLTLESVRALDRERGLRRVDAGLRALVAAISGLPTPRAILEVVVEQLRAVFAADAASAWMAGQDALILHAASGFSDRYLAVVVGTFQTSPGLAALTDGHAVFMADRATYPDAIGRAAAAEDLHTMLFLPMIVERRPVGGLILAYRHVLARDDELIAQAEGFARQAGLAIQTAQLLRAKADLAAMNARLYEAEVARARQLDALLRLSQRLHGTSDPDTLAQEVVDAVTSALGFRVAVINVRRDPPDGGPTEFVAQAISGADAEERSRLLGVASSNWETWLRPEFRTGRCYLLPPEYVRTVPLSDAFAIPDLPPAGPGEWDPYHALFVPIGGEGIESRAILSVDEPVDRRLPSAATLDTLEAFAAQAALALEMAQLHTQTRRRAGELEGIIGSMMDAVMLLTVDGRAQPLNRAASLLQQPGNPLAPAQWGRLRDIEGTLVPVEQLPMARALRGERVAPVDLLAPAGEDRLCWLSVTGAPILSKAGTVEGAVLVIRDVSAERDLERLRRSFVATVSHELRTPLSAIIGFGELLSGRWDDIDDGRKRTMLSHIVGSAGRLERLVADLLLVSQVEAGELRVRPSLVDLRVIAEQAAAEVKVRFPGTRIEIPATPHAMMAYVDRDRMQEVLSNLVDNAAKYGGESGPVAVRWAICPALDSAAGDHPSHGPAVEVRVVDHGGGIAPEYRGRLFTRFGKLDQRQMRGGHVGTGLGLFICRKLVEAMGGAIWYEETPGGGGTFAVRLPASRTEPAPNEGIRSTQRHRDTETRD